jgi:hypothetical protein
MLMTLPTSLKVILIWQTIVFQELASIHSPIQLPLEEFVEKSAPAILLRVPLNCPWSNVGLVPEGPSAKKALHPSDYYHILCEQVYSITLNYQQPLSFNPYPQNQLFSTQKLSKSSYITPFGGFRICGATSATIVVTAPIGPTHFTVLSPCHASLGMPHRYPHRVDLPSCCQGKRSPCQHSPWTHRHHGQWPLSPSCP